MAKEWYENNTWNETIASEFEAKLKRARGSYSKSQYLKIQGHILLFATDEKLHSIGLDLLNRLFTDYPSETLNVVSGYDSLAMYYLWKKNWKQAEHYYRIVISYLGIPYILSPYREAKLKLAETLLHLGTEEALDEAYELIVTFPVDELGLNDKIFGYYELAALVSAAMNKKAEAEKYARWALGLTNITEPQFTRHKTVGIIKATKVQISVLERIAGK